MRVLSLSTLFPNAARPGFGLFVARQAESVARLDDVDLVLINPIAIAPQPLRRFINSPAELALPTSARDWGVEVHYPRYTWLPRIGPRWNPGLIARAVLPLARQLHAERPFDLVDAQFFYPDGPAAASLARALGLPLSIKARGSDIHLWGAKSFARKAMLAASQQAAGLLAVSSALKADMAALGMAADKIAVHYTGLDHTLFRPLPRDEACALAAELVPGEGPLLLSIGNLIPLKGHHLVIEALVQLPGARLIIAGRGPEEQRLGDLAKRLGVADRVAIPGAVPPDALAVLLNAADAMVLASEREGLANVWIEALACGTPLVITAGGSASEVVSDHSAGRVAERSPAIIAAAVRDLLDSPPTRKEVAAHAAKFSWEANSAQLAAHWRKISGASAALIQEI